MKNLMLYITEKPLAASGSVSRLLALQVDNSLDLGWCADDILIYTNFPFAHRGVRAIEVEPGQRPRTARATSYHKTQCILRAFDRVGPADVIWYHDVDAFQLVPFDGSPLTRDLAFCLYSTRERLLVQGGSLFFTSRALPVFSTVFDQLVNHRCRKDEFALTDVAARPEFAGRFQILDYSHNLGSTDFELRYQLSELPIKVAHFHPERAEHLACFVEGRNGLGIRPLDERFLGLLDRHGFIDRDEVRADGGWMPTRHPSTGQSTGTLSSLLRRAFAG